MKEFLNAFLWKNLKRKFKLFGKLQAQSPLVGRNFCIAYVLCEAILDTSSFARAYFLLLRSDCSSFYYPDCRNRTVPASSLAKLGVRSKHTTGCLQSLPRYSFSAGMLGKDRGCSSLGWALPTRSRSSPLNKREYRVQSNVFLAFQLDFASWLCF